MDRQSWDEYYMGLAKSAASRSTCPRLAVGAVIVKDKSIVATGYNGSIRNAPHCCDKGCLIEDGHCIAAVHAELNALLAAAKNGVSIAFSVMYVTHNPCLNCYKAMVNAGIKRIVYGEMYREVNYAILGLNGNTSPELVQFKVPKTIG